MRLQLRMIRNTGLYPWFKFTQSLIFWQATWFLYFENHLSAAEAILLYAIYDLATTVLEVPSGYLSDRVGRRLTLIAAAVSGLLAVLLFIVGTNFVQFALANILLGASAAFASGTDSSMLFESLKAAGRSDEIEAAELKAWRYGFSALALSALIGGFIATHDDILPYVATAVSAAALIALTLLFKEPPHEAQAQHRENIQNLVRSLTQPTLFWLLCLTLLMYVFSHIPFVFGQPFIREALTGAGYAAQAPLISGGVTFIMMLVSVTVSLVALPLRKRLGLSGIVLLAFGMQIALAAALATSDGLFIIGLLFLRMVPDSISQPFIRARVQTLLPDGVRATYFSVQSLAGRILFAVTLGLAASNTSSGELMPYAEMQVILTANAVVGVVLLAALAFTARRAKV